MSMLFVDKDLLTFNFQHKYHTKIDDQIEKTSANMRVLLIGKLVSVLEKTLGKLSAYDEGSMMGSILSFAVTIMPSLNGP